LTLNPDLFEALYNGGNALQLLERYEAAIESYERALEVEPALRAIWFNLAFALRSVMRFDEAIEAFERALELGPTPGIPSRILQLTRMDQCDWTDIDRTLATIREGVERGEPVVHPFALLAMVDSPSLQQSAARILARAKYPATGTPPSLPPPANRIRLAYFSADFTEHAVAYLTAELFETMTVRSSS
jgi:tetratricopeptide (TPR) repeat protein